MRIRSTITLAFLCVPLLLGLAGEVRADAVYFVKEGDTAVSVARFFKTTQEVIAKANRLGGELLVPGTRLVIPDTAIAAFSAPVTPAPGAGRTPAAQNPAVQPVVAGEVAGETADLVGPLPSCSERLEYHEVRRGDSPWSIAGKHGLTVNQLLGLNGLKRNRVLQIGERLVVRRAGPRTHLVAKGESLWTIARATNVSVDDINGYNRLAGSDLLPGRKLYLQACEEEPAHPSLASVPGEGPVQGPPPRAVAPEPPGFTERVLNFAANMLNIPYKWGGTTLKGLDCSAFVQKVFAPLDVILPRTVPEQFKLGEVVPRTELAAGDLVFFQTFARYPSHVGIYMGDNRFIHASSKARKIMVTRFDKPYYTQRYIGAKRLRQPARPGDLDELDRLY